jgi:4-amino-4-deoxy-L-arabinose transferase-like glycosyltransferase
MRDEKRDSRSRFTFYASRLAPRVSRPAIGLACIVLAYLAISIQYAALTPDWQVPDEPAHYNYVRFIAENGSLPVLEFGDYDQKFNEQFTNPAHTPKLPIDPLRYEYHQPPLYYLLVAPIYLLTGGDLFALRLVSVAFGGALIVVAYLVVRRIKPDRPALALGTAAFAAFVPQHVAMLAGVNNDSLAELLLALILLQTLRVLKSEEGRASRGLLWLGVLLGLGLITKTTDYLAVPIVFMALLPRIMYRVSPSAKYESRITHYAIRFMIVFIPAFILGSFWWLRNIGVYGGFDVLGLARHNAVVVGQPLTTEWIARMGLGPYLVSALTTTFHSFWGQFGWMGVPMPDGVYHALGALSVIAVVGWLWPFRLSSGRSSSGRSSSGDDSYGAPSLPYPPALLFLLTLFTFAAYIWYNLTFVQHQGRYLFPALIPLGLMFSIGIERWTRLLPRRIGWLVCAAAFIGLAALAAYALHRWVIPSLAG